VTSYWDVHGAGRRIASLAGRLRPGSDLLEIVCGTGMWTRHLVGSVANLTRQLTQLGWQAAITPSGDWLAGQARPMP
jgi:ubiquinone/menaquinone biosynthesis C-methylase UbiE